MTADGHEQAEWQGNPAETGHSDHAAEPTDGTAQTDAAELTDSAASTDAATGSDTVPGPATCASDKDCKDQGQVCDPLTSVCVACLTDAEWALVTPFLPAPACTGRPRC